jgi:deoxyribodipyrimidine photo-lyase
MKKGIFIFRRDLRLVDNIGLIKALKTCKDIYPIFIFTPEQITNKNEFKSNNAIQFMIESLKDLDNELKKKKSRLHIFYGDNLKVLEEITNSIKIDYIFFNRDYTPYALKRDKDIANFCESKNIVLVNKEDYLLHKIGSISKNDNSIYKVFTPFKNKGLKLEVKKPKKCSFETLSKLEDNLYNSINSSSDYIDISFNNKIIYQGGRNNALQQIKKLKNQSNYNHDRNMLIKSTSKLSAYIKFGNLSIREVYWKIKKLYGNSNNLIDQLYWREFYFYIAFYFPKVLKGENYNSKYDDIKWNTNKKIFEKWCNGNTGYPIIDAGMNELNETGYMHNRARLITSNFLNRILGMDWRLGEKYYSTKLVDYDPSVNNGNWQWIASTGVDPKPYFQRLFNPWTQGLKYDKNAEYIKKWVPQLKDIPSKDLHNWEEKYMNYDLKKLKYFKPIVSYKEGRKLSIEMYRSILK